MAAPKTPLLEHCSPGRRKERKGATQRALLKRSIPRGVGTGIGLFTDNHGASSGPGPREGTTIYTLWLDLEEGSEAGEPT
jgi:hypothetical protein